MSIRKVSSALQLKAKNELNEVPERIEDDIKHIRVWLSKQPHLKCRTDDQWLLTFLRGCKFSLQRTKEKLDSFYTIRTMIPELFSNRDPLQPEIQEVLKRGHLLFLPKTADPAGPKVAILRLKKNADAEIVDFINLMKTIFMILDILCIEDDNAIIGGKAGVTDLEEFPFKYITQATPSLLNKIMTCVQSAYPIRIKEVLFINVPPFAETILGLVKMFLSEKIKNRFNFFSNMKDVYKTIPSSILPKDYGGEGPSCEEIAAQWKQKVESYREWFLEDEQYRSDESKRPGKPKISADILGVEGSFRKLEVD